MDGRGAAIPTWVELEVVFLGKVAERAVGDFEQVGSFCLHAAGLLQG